MKMLLADQWVDREKTIDVHDPFDNSVVDTVPAATEEDVETAMAAADEGRQAARAMSTYGRSQILLETASIIAENLAVRPTGASTR
jgi:glyceraldehyde-3-phosphate dehydrogenase (NADP+)